MKIFKLSVRKNGQADAKHSKNYSTKEELDADFAGAKRKYNAKDGGWLPFLDIPTAGNHTLFQTASGKCRHGKAVELIHEETTTNDSSSTKRP